MTHSMQEADDVAFQTKLENTSPEKLMNQAILILQKPFEAKTKRDIEVLQKYSEKFEFFRNFAKQKGDALHAELCKHLNYEISKAGDTLFEAGSMGTKFYIILRGAVEVYVNIPKTSTEGKEVLVSEKISELKEGMLFGELAIMEEILKPRKATIKTKSTSDCVLVTLERDHYQRILGHMTQEINAHVDFLEGLSHFKNTGWTKRTLQNIVKNFDKHIYPRNHVIYKEGDPCDFVFLIKSGEVRCSKAVRMTGDTKNFVVDENSNLYPFDEAPAKKVAEVSIMASGQLFGEEEALLYVINRKDLSFRLTQYLKKLTVLRDLFGAQKQSVSTARGEEKLLYSKNSIAQQVHRETRVTVNSLTAEIWKMPAKLFFTQIDSYKNTLDSIITTILNKRKRREDRIADIIDNVPLQPVSITRSPEYLQANIVSFTKHKKYIGPRQAEQMVYCNMSFDSTINRDTQQDFYQGSNSQTASPKSKSKPHLTKPVSLFSPRNKGNQESKLELSSPSASPSRKNSPTNTNVDKDRSPHPGLSRASTKNLGFESPRREHKITESPVALNKTISNMKRAYSTQQKSSRKVLVIDNPLNNSSIGHESLNHSRVSLLGDNRVSNKSNDVVHHDFENFFNNSIRVKKVTYKQRHNNNSFSASTTKSPLTTLDKDHHKTSNLLPQLRNNRQYSRKDLKNDLRLGTLNNSGSMTEKQTLDSQRHDDETLGLVSSFVTPKDAKAYDRRRQKILASFKPISAKPSPRDINPMKIQDTAQVLIKSLQVHRDLFSRKGLQQDEDPMGKSQVMSSISQAVQAKKAGIILGKESLPTSASGQISFRQRTQDLRANAKALRQSRLKYYDVPPDALRASQMHPLNRTQDMSHRSQRSHRDKLKDVVQGKIGEKFRLPEKSREITTSNRKGRYQDLY